MRHLLGSALLLLVIPGTSSVVQQATTSTNEYTGKLEPELIADRPATNIQLKAATEEERSKMPVAAAKDDKVFAGKLLRQIGKNTPSLLLVEPAKGEAYLYVDFDCDGTFTAAERVAFSAIPANDNPWKADGEAVLKFPLAGSPFKYYPIRLYLQKPAAKAMEDNARFLPISLLAFAEGKVNIDGRQMLVRYGANATTGLVNPVEGYVGMDCDGDGKIDSSRVSPESVYASSDSKKEARVFHVGKHYVSTASLDPAAGKIVLREHPASDYTRIEMRVGAEVSDFAFTDFNGKEHKLSEFHGKYLMLEFWGTWCGPCVAEIPHMKAAYEKYKSRGFEILGMDFEEPVIKDKNSAAAQQEAFEKAKKFVGEKAMAWTQATTASVKEIITERFRISAYPTTLLIDPQGKIISLGEMGGKDQLPLRGEKLMGTLEKVLPVQQ